MKCHKCKKEFKEEVLTFARNEKGVKPKTGFLYCPTCEEVEYQRKLLVEYMHQCFIYYGYYNTSKTKENKDAKTRLMGLINKQIQNLTKEGYTYIQIRLVVEYMIINEHVEFSDSILGLVPYYFSKTSKHHLELFRISNSKKYGYIAPTKVDVKREVIRPNKSASRITNIELL